MSTVLLLGSSGPTQISLTSLLESLGCSVLLAKGPGPHAHIVKLTLAVIEFRPQDITLAEFTEQLHRLAPLPTVVTGPELPEHRVAGLLVAAHVGSYLRLGATTAEKREALRPWLPELPGPVLTLGQLRMNLRDQSVHYGGHPLTFTSTELRLLQVLMQRPGVRVDCATLAVLANCANVPAHLGNMRRKLAECAGVPLLRTTPDQGYTLDARRTPRLLPAPGLALRTHLRQLL